MPNEIIPFDQFQAPSTIFAKSTVDAAKFMGGIQASFAILTIKGKEWGIRYRGVSQQLTAPNPMAGNALMPVQFLDVVVIDAAASISKVFYLHGFKDGDRTPPDCWSANGVVPDPASPHLQSPTCRGCKHNVFGSKVGDGGQKGKACPDNKRLALVPVSDIKNEAFGGPVMLRLPPGSFSPYAEFVGKMASRQYPPYAVACRLTFQANEAYPRIVFTPLRPLNDQEAALVLEAQANPALERMLTDPAVGAMADAEVEDGGAGTSVPPPPPPPITTPPPVTTPAQTGFGTAAAAPQQTAPPATQPAGPIAVPAGGFGVPAASQPAGPVANGQTDDLAIPPHLRASERAASPELPLTNPPSQPVTAPQEVLTPEQIKIRELEAQLAAAKAPKTRKARSQPVSPPATQTTVTQPGNGFGTPAPVQQAAADPAETAAQTTVGNSIADRIAALAGAAKA